MNIIQASIRHRQVTLTILAIVFVVGVYSLFNMPRREDPKITVPVGLVVAHYPGASAAEVEEQVTKRLEEYLFQFEEVKKAYTHSTTRDGYVVVTVTLHDNVKQPDIFWNKLRHQLMVAKILDMPQGVRGPIVNSDFGDTEALLIAVTSENASYQELKNYGSILETKLRETPNASKIKRIGEQKEQITVYFSSEALAHYNISLQQIIKVLQSQNEMSPAGEIQSGEMKVALYTNGTYRTINDVEQQIVGSSTTGAVVRLKDIATIKREYATPKSTIDVNGRKAIIITVQMQEGKNIVKFGKEVDKILEETTKELPSNVQLTTIVNQPKMVDNNVSRFLGEFLFAIVSVIIVLILLLPFNMAAIATTAIPMTIAVTFAILNAFGTELHQVSLASLILVLGMVVDDAIVVADNYLALLEKGLDRKTAAWRSATDLVVPILGATITIIAAFIPMMILTGVIGEFIHDLPVTVTVAFTASFLVSMLFTPILCYMFVREAPLKAVDATGKPKKKKKLLDHMQQAYNVIIEWFANHKIITIAFSVFIILMAGVIFKTAVGQKFFPYAERNQFVVELWMPTGTKLEKTQDALKKIEALIEDDKRVSSYASFAGQSAPRVYYNFSPEFPASNYGQILINTLSNKDTEKLAKELEKQVEAAVPEGTAQVKLMQQGLPLIAPVEVLIYGDNIQHLKEISAKVQAIIKSKQGSVLVRDNFKEDYYGISLDLKKDAQRLGFTASSIGQMVYANMSGYPVTTIYEGENDLEVVVRSGENKRATYQDIENIYVQSPVTGASVPLRQVASIVLQWQAGQIMHRKGMRCLTVGSEVTENVLPSELLDAIRPEIESMVLPHGYTLDFGGEHANKTETFGRVLKVLGISLILIFVILLLQFKNLKELFIVMLTIPLSLFGAVLGLAITGNNFGFTAFVGLISLSGIVIRNAIILIDQANELIDNGFDIKTAAIEAGKRRMRPIFLTTMSTSIGLLPLILSGSSLWSPLASVIAFGVTWGMIMALITVPVLYIMLIKPKDKMIADKITTSNFNAEKGLYTTIIILALMVIPAHAQKTSVKYTLQEMQEMALDNNHLLKIKQMQVDEKKQKVNEDRVKFFPNIAAGANYQYNTHLPALTIEQGSFGTLPMLYVLPTGGFTHINVELPADDKTFVMGDHHTYNASVTAYQPISQLPKINAGVKVSKTEMAIAQTEKEKVSMQIKQGVEQLYFGLLITHQQKEESELKIEVAASKLKDAESAVIAGKATNTALYGLKASLADEQQSLLKINMLMEDYKADLIHLTGLSAENDIIPVAIVFNESDYLMDSYNGSNISENDNLDLKLAKLTYNKANNALKASQYNYLPDVGIFGGYSYQEGNKLYPTNNTFAGVSFKWDIQNIATNTFAKNQRSLLTKQAEEHVAYTREEVNTKIAKSYRRISQSLELIKVAEKVLEFRREDMKVQTDKQQTGLSINTDYLTAKAAVAKAAADYYGAQLNYRMALTDLHILIGKY